MLRPNDVGCLTPIVLVASPLCRLFCHLSSSVMGFIGKILLITPAPLSGIVSGLPAALWLITNSALSAPAPAGRKTTVMVHVWLGCKLPHVLLYEKLAALAPVMLVPVIDN